MGPRSLRFDTRPFLFSFEVILYGNQLLFDELHASLDKDESSAIVLAAEKNMLPVSEYLENLLIW